MTPKISIVIPVLNGTTVLPTQLRCLEQQDFSQEWEVVVADNGSTDDIATVIADWADRLPNLRLVRAGSFPGDGYAKHVGAMMARSERIAMCDADDLVSRSWVRAMYEGLDHDPMVTGPVRMVPFEAGLSDTVLFDDHESYSHHPPQHRGQPYAPGCNCGFRAEALPEGYAADYVTAGDGATSFRARLLGYEVAWCPDARILRRRRPDGRQSLQRSVASGVGLAKLDREFAGRLWPPRRPRLLRRSAWVLLHVPELLREPGRGRWSYEVGALIGTSIETILPGAWVGRRLARRDHANLGLVAQVHR